MKNVLVTGGAGFIGSNFVHYLLENGGVKVTTLDALTYAGSLSNLQGLADEGRHRFVEGDICERALVEGLLREDQIDTIVHFAAESHVDRSIHGPGEFVRTNIEGTYVLLDAARMVWLEDQGDYAGKKFHHVSTDEVYGSLGPDDPAFTERTSYAPSSPYAASKAASDHLVRAYAHTYALPVLITNCSNNYGPRQFPEKLIPVVILNALGGNKIPIYGDGQQIRDWLYVEDHCVALLEVLRDGVLGETYNIGGNNQPTNLEIVRSICTVLDRLLPDSPHKPHDQLIEFVPDRPGHDRRYAMDITKIKTQLGWEPQQSLLSGLEKTIQWYLEHGDCLQKIIEEKDFQEWMHVNYADRGRTI
jgi:dTDP-glucose 4,6-dehydratase